MAEVMSMIPEENAPGELNADEQDSLQVGEQMQQDQEQMLAGKYKNAQELESAYLELQKKLGESNTTEESTEETVEEQEEEQEESPDASLLDRLWEESKGEFSEETLKELAEAKPGDLAKMYLEYRNEMQSNEPRQLTEQDVQGLKGVVGGEENYDNMVQWASQNMSEDEVTLYDEVMDSGNPAAAYFAVQALAYKYQDSIGVEGNLIQGKAPSNNQNVFRSQAELVEAMNDPRYSRDPAYRQEIMQKLERSDIDF
jgi:hypothetical protein|tara:strand:+ start:430 stop:1197 length:768 start_codon:yes stop_codon:yes gene_type:complete